MPDYNPLLDRLEAALGRDHQADGIKEDTWRRDVMEALQETSWQVAADLGTELAMSWEKQDIATGEIAVRQQFENDPHPRLLATALICVAWVSWQNKSHANLGDQTVDELLNAAWAAGKNRP